MDGAKGCGSGTASLARPGCGLGKVDAFPKRGRKVDLPAALSLANLRAFGAASFPKKETNQIAAKPPFHLMPQLQRAQRG